MAARIKFRVTERADLAYFASTTKRVTFVAVADTSIPTDDRITSTPSITFSVIVDNPIALAQFELGAELYADFSPVPT